MPLMDTVKIDGVKLNIDTDPSLDGSVEIPQRYFMAIDEGSFWQTWEIRSFEGGERRKRILSESQLTEMTYDDGRSIDVSTWGELKIQPDCARSLAIQSSTLPMVTSNDGSTVIAGITASPYIKRYLGNPGAWANPSSNPGAAVTDIIAAKGQTLYAIAGTGTFVSTDNGNTWAATGFGTAVHTGTAQDSEDNNTTHIVLASGASATSGTYVGQTVTFTGGTGSGQTSLIISYNGTTKVATMSAVQTAPDETTTYSISSDIPSSPTALAFCANQLYALTTSVLKYWDGAAWQEAADFGGDFACTYGEQVYFADDNIIYRYNGTSAFEADRLPQGFTITGLYSYRNILFIPGYFLVQGGKKGAVYFILDGRDSHLFNIGSYDGSSDNTVSAVCGGDDEIYFSNQSRGGADRYDMSVGGLSSGPAWGSTGVIPFKGMAYSNGKLFVARYDNVAGTDGVYIANTTIPTAWETTGWLTTPSYDWFFPNDYKVFSQIVVWHKALAAGEYITIHYSVDDGVNYTFAGTSAEVGATMKAFKITNARGRSLKLMISLNGQGTSTPTVTYVRADAAPLGEAKSMWDLNLVMYSPLQGRQQITSLKNSYNSQQVVTFEDQYGEEHSVVFEYLRIKLLTGDKWTAKVMARLREV